MAYRVDRGLGFFLKGVSGLGPWVRVYRFLGFGVSALRAQGLRPTVEDF